MILLNKRNYNGLYNHYLQTDFFFPLIASVLRDEQNGVIYVNDPISPSQAYIEHVFGFAQVIGETDKSFEHKLQRYLFINKEFGPNKIRLYAPQAPQFLKTPQYQSSCSYRQRFTLNTKNINPQSNNMPALDKISLCKADKTNLILIENKFGVVSRFWRNSTDFLLKANAVIVLFEGEPSSICYAAAEANKKYEIDVLTLPEFRNLGLARQAVLHFINQCHKLSSTPLWDCFTNNAGSMALCKSVGFDPINPPYPFFTINK